MDLKNELSAATAKVTPAAAGSIYAGVTLNQAVAAATLIYIALQAGFLVYKWYWTHQDRKDDKLD